MGSSTVASGLTQPVAFFTPTTLRSAGTNLPTAPAVEAAVVSAPSTQQLQSAIQKVQTAMQPATGNIVFTLDQSTGRAIVKVVDAETGDLIRQIPSEEMLAIASAIDEVRSILLPSKA